MVEEKNNGAKVKLFVKRRQIKRLEEQINQEISGD
jgi:hypothetical protein